MGFTWNLKEKVLKKRQNVITGTVKSYLKRAVEIIE